MDIDLTKSMRDFDSFHRFENFYSENFIVDDEEEENLTKSVGHKKKKFGLKSKLSLYDGIKEDQQRSFSMANSRMIDRQGWDAWVNIYSEDTLTFSEYNGGEKEIPASA